MGIGGAELREKNAEWREKGARGRIRALPALLVNQIAAGEVVERPASVVKELVDNALDAGAGRVFVELEQGGVELVRVSDDGGGISREDLDMAVAAHATSKISTVEDLDRIGTMGFRGEALASIAAVSRLSIRSRTADEPGAWRIDASGAEIAPVRPDSGPVGTTVSVRNLFFNTPARRKFLRAPGTEQSHCVEIVRSLAMAHPRIGFRVTADGRSLVDLAPGHSPRERVEAVLGAELGDKLLEVSADVFDDARGLTLWGVVGLPELARPTAKAQRLFVNGRPVRDQTVMHALQEAYRGLIDPRRKPTAAIMIAMSPTAVDVNVHPAKAEVRFRDASLVHSVVLRAVREALRAADLTPGWEWGAPGSAPGTEMRAEFGAGRAPGQETEAKGANFSRAGGFAETFQRPSLATPGGAPFDYEALRRAVEAERAREAATPGPILHARQAERVLQVHNSYLVTQDEQGVVIIDQHALHERVMFEQIMSRLGGGTLESQRMLTPAVVSAQAHRLALLEGLRPLLARLGVEAEAIGPGAAAVHAFPTFLFERRVDPAEFLGELLERAEQDDLPAGEEEALHAVVDMMACKAAVKAGDRLSEEELSELLEMRERFERSSSCPHGRPTTIRLTLRDLEKRFGRG